MDSIDSLFNVKYNNEPPLAGKLLIAEPFLTDYPFCRSVVLLVNHSTESSMGLVLNVPIQQSLNHVVTELQSIETIPLYRGGPLGEDILFFIHTYGCIEGAFPISEGLYLNGDFDLVKNLLIKGSLDPKQFRFFLGYSGWGASQLETELEHDAWLVTCSSSQYIIEQNPHKLWEGLLHRMGNKYKIWARYPLIPTHN